MNYEKTNTSKPLVSLNMVETYLESYFGQLDIYT